MKRHKKTTLIQDIAPPRGLRHSQRLNRQIGLMVGLAAVAAIPFWLTDRYAMTAATASLPVKPSFEVFLPPPTERSIGDGYRYDQTSPSLKNKLLVYGLRGPGGVIAVTQQAGFDKTKFDNFVQTNLPLRSEYKTPDATYAIGALGRQAVATTLTDKGTWLIATAPPEVSQADLTAVLSALKLDD